MRTPTSRFPLARAGRWIAVLALVGGAALVVPSSEAAQHGGQQGRLSITPTQASPGETLTLTGSLPTKVRRPIAVQRGMYGNFFDVAHGRTDAHGRFRIQIPKNGMPSDPYRVVARKVRVHHHVYPAITTPARTIKTLEPELNVTLSETSVGVGGHATLTAYGNPVRSGRPLTLQRRLTPTTWQAVGTSRLENARGEATFVLPTSATGTTTYRVVASAWRGAAWFPSFPVTLSVGTLPGPPRAAAPGTSGGPSGAATARIQPGPVNAANTFKWGPMAERWEWEAGESTDPWQIYADGTGRSSIYMAMLTLESGMQGGPMVSTGTVKATLHNAGHRYGRWEARVRGPIFQSGNADYTMGLNLVPTTCATAGTPCAGPSVNLGTWTGYQSATMIGACKNGTSWSTTRSLARNRDNWHTLGVEITPKRIVWFVDAKVASVLKNPGAVPGVALVPQMVLQGRPGDVRMNRTKLTADWVRYFTLKQKDKGRIAGSAPTAKTVAGGC